MNFLGHIWSIHIYCKKYILCNLFHHFIFNRKKVKLSGKQFNSKKILIFYFKLFENQNEKLCQNMEICP